MKMRLIIKLQTVYTIVCALFVLFFNACIVRDNPCDPVNFQSGDSLDSYCKVVPIKPPPAPLFADSMGTILDSLLAELEKIKRESVKDSLFLYEKNNEDSSNISANNIIIKKNSQKMNKNIIIDRLAGKKHLSCHTTKYILDSLKKFKSVTYKIDIQEKEELQKSIMKQVEKELIYSFKRFPKESSAIKEKENQILKFSDNLRQFLVYIDYSQSSFWKQRNNYTKKFLQPQNNKADSINLIVRQFNINLKKDFCGLAIGKYEVIRSALEFVKPGGIIRLEAGKIPIPDKLQMTRSGDSANPIVFLGDAAKQTIFTSDKSDLMLISEAKYLEFYFIDFTGSNREGIRIEGNSGPVKFENCNFSNNESDGIYASQVQLSLTNCTITGNKTSGIVINSSGNDNQYPENIHFENILVANNGTSGIHGISIEGSIINSTIVNNGSVIGFGVTIKVPKPRLTFENCIIAYNGDAEIQTQDGGIAMIMLKSNNIYDDSSSIPILDPPEDNLVWNYVGPSLKIPPQFSDSVNFEPLAPELKDIGYRKKGL